MIAMQKTAGPESVGRINDRLAMDLLLRHGPLTRKQLRSLTGMAQPTTAVLIDRLCNRGLVEPGGESKEARRGPNAQKYQIKAGSAHVAVARLNALEIAAAIADVTGRVVAEYRCPIQDASRPVSEVQTALDIVMRDAGLTGAQLDGIVLGTPGSVNPSTGDVSYVSEHPEWRGSVKRPLEEKLGQSVHIENQLKLAGLAELTYGRGFERDSLVLLSVGPGVGMSIIIGRDLWRGASGGAGEIAYLPVPEADVPRIDVGQNHVTGGFGDLINTEALQTLVDQAGFAGITISDAVRQAAKSPDEQHPLICEIGRRIAIGIASVSAVFDPGLVVLTGSVARAGGQRLSDIVEAKLAQMSPWHTEIQMSGVEGDAVIKGAIVAALDPIHNAMWGPKPGWRPSQSPV
ncbi:MAG: ROK family transcriptional regulator [Microbacteriaceae bacterium]|nr:MAG: ROK family transcriptional regulator [Microbacteriaceae bacterium]